MKQYQCKSSYHINSFAKKELEVTFYFEKKIIPDNSMLYNDNKRTLMPIIELYEIIFSKINILS